jgi:GNAT superfamily N-acetyltransferase
LIQWLQIGEEMSNISYREAGLADCAEVAKVHVRSWRESFAGLVPETVMERITVEKRTKAFAERFQGDAYRMYVAEVVDRGVIGFADCGEPREKIDPYQAELYAIFLLPEFQGAGVGRRLFSSCVEGLVKSGKSSMYLLAFEKSPYRSFYDKLGGVVIGKRQVDIEGTVFAAVVYGWKDLS